MNRLGKMAMATALAAAMFMNSSAAVWAAPKEMADGTVFDAEFYAQTYPDVKEALGTDENALYQHYVTFGRSEGRLPFAPAPMAQAAGGAAQEAQTAGGAAQAAAGETAQNAQAAPAVTQETLDAADVTHKYYKYLNAEQAAQGDLVASAIAAQILAEPSYTTDCQRIDAAARKVAEYCNACVYGGDQYKYYRSPYGVFVAGVYTCSGSTRALGRVLDYMGYSWEHMNENENRHQWCIVTMDGQKGYADGMGGFAGYGEMKNGMQVPDGRIIFFS